MALYQKRIRSHALRRRGLSIIRISTILGVSKSTVSEWCRDVVLTEKQKENLRRNTIKGGHKGRMLGAEMNKSKRLSAVKLANEWAQKTVGTLSKREVAIAASALYWSEGSKSYNTYGFLFVNSDPDMILFIKEFLSDLGVEKKDLFCTIQINEIHRSRIKKVLNYWKKLLDLPIEQIGSPSFVKTKVRKVYDNYENYFGICRLKVRKSSMLKYKMLGLIECLKKKNI